MIFFLKVTPVKTEIEFIWNIIIFGLDYYISYIVDIFFFVIYKIA